MKKEYSEKKKDLDRELGEYREKAANIEEEKR